MNLLLAEEMPQTESIYSEEELSLLDLSKAPRHVAIVMDGNRRWAKQRYLPAMAGHWRGADTLSKIVRAASHLNIRVLTVYSFSTENWLRSVEEVDALMQLFEVTLKRQRENMIQEGVRLGVIGDLSRIPARVRSVIEETVQATQGGTKIDLVLAVNYGGRDDIRRAAQMAIEDALQGKIKKEDLTEEKFAGYLDTAPWGDPDLFIRTSGEQRVSNFLLWQISYAEVYLPEVLWPDFNEKELLKAVSFYQKREKRFGA